MRGRAPWAGIEVPVLAPDGWTRTEIDAGLSELERIRRGVDAASAALVTGLGTTGRDTAAAVARATGRSGRSSRELVRAAEVAGRVPGASEALAHGEVSVEHLRALAPISDAGDAAELLTLAVVQSPEEFIDTVTRFELDRDEAGLRERQRATRSVRFFPAEHGNVGMRAVLTPVEGAELRGAIDRIVDAAWRREHPERARTVGEHNAAPIDQRRADALMTLVRGERVTGGGRPSVIVVVDEERLNAKVAGTGPGAGPIPFTDAVDLAQRGDVYAAVRSADGVTLNFGRSRRLATALQRLAVTVRDGGRCAYPGCDAGHERCAVHHVVEYEHGGTTDLANLALLCSRHHTHLHTNRLRLTRAGPGWNVAAAAGIGPATTTDPWPDTG